MKYSLFKKNRDENFDLDVEIRWVNFHWQPQTGPISGPNPNPKQNHKK